MRDMSAGVHFPEVDLLSLRKRPPDHAGVSLTSVDRENVGLKRGKVAGRESAVVGDADLRFL
jgi:hypothetical protein